MGTVRKPAATSNRRHVSITRRDVAIMELLVERRAETLDELAGRFVAAGSRKRALNRLGQLSTAGYLQRTKLPVPGFEDPQNVYTLGPKGKRALELRSPAAVELFKDRRFNPTLRTASLPHQIVTNRVGDLLGVRLTPEHLLGKRNDTSAVRPDGVYLAGDEDSRRREVWVEVDLGTTPAAESRRRSTPPYRATTLARFSWCARRGSAQTRFTAGSTTATTATPGSTSTCSRSTSSRFTTWSSISSRPTRPTRTFRF
jgi:hypothetical protein